MRPFSELSSLGCGLSSFFVLSLLLLLTGCSEFRIHADLGIANPWMGGERWFKSRNVNPLRVIQSGLHLESTLVDTKYFALDSGAGPMILGGDQGWVLGVESLTRLRFKAHPRVHPYIISRNGVGYAEGWKGSNVPYTFTTGLGVGALIGLRPRLAMTVDLSWKHISNGMTVHSDKTRQFFGLVKATRNQGYQNLGLSVGLIWSF